VGLRSIRFRAGLVFHTLLFGLAICGPALVSAKSPAPGKLKVSPGNLEFPAVASGSGETLPLTLENVGGAPLTGSVGTPAGTGFSVISGGGNFSLATGAMTTVTVEFAPSSVGKFSGKLPVAAGKSKLSVGLTGTGTPVSSGTVILFGGVPNTQDIIATSEIFTSSTGSFSSAPKMPDSRGFEHYAPYLDPAVVGGGAAGMIFVSGGQDDSDFILGSTLLYDPSSNSFVDGPQLNTARAEHTVTLFTAGNLSGQVLIVGGLQLEGDTRIALDDQELYDPAAGTISDLGPNMNDYRGQHTATLLSNGTVLVTGGYDDNFDRDGFNEATATAELFEPGSQTFSCVSSGASSSTSTSDCPDVMSSPRWNHRATLLADDMTVLVSGGTPTDSGTREGTSSADLYDGNTNSFKALPNMNSARQGHTATLIQGCGCALDGMVLLAGGQNQTGKVLATAELYDPATQTFTNVGNMTSPRAEHQAVAFTTGSLAGYVLIMGGYPEPNEQGTNSAELFDPFTRSFRKIASMKSDRYEFPATLVPPG
jgi:hypothetical protein